MAVWGKSKTTKDFIFAQPQSRGQDS